MIAIVIILVMLIILVATEPGGDRPHSGSEES